MAAQPQLLIGGRVPEAPEPTPDRDALIRQRIDRWCLELAEVVVMLGVRQARLDLLRAQLDDKAIGTPEQRAWAWQRETEWTGRCKFDLIDVAGKIDGIVKQRGLLSTTARRRIAEDRAEDAWANGTDAELAESFWQAFGLRPPPESRGRPRGKRS